MVSDDSAVRDSVKDMMESIGVGVEMFESLRKYNGKAEPQIHQCLILDTHKVDLDGEDERSILEAVSAAISVILITDRGDVSTAVRGMKSGVVDIVQKPYFENRLLDSVMAAINAQTLGNGKVP